MSEGTYKVHKEIQFCSAHRLLGHEGHCKYIHGHNYKAVIQLESVKLDEVGRVIDFSVIKTRVKAWIDEHWDHSFIANIADEAAIKAMTDGGFRYSTMPNNPTAENMAYYLLEMCRNMFAGERYNGGVQVTGVTIWETDDSCATVDVGYRYQATIPIDNEDGKES